MSLFQEETGRSDNTMRPRFNAFFLLFFSLSLCTGNDALVRDVSFSNCLSCLCLTGLRGPRRDTMRSLCNAIFFDCAKRQLQFLAVQKSRRCHSGCRNICPPPTKNIFRLKTGPVYALLTHYSLSKYYRYRRSPRTVTGIAGFRCTV